MIITSILLGLLIAGAAASVTPAQNEGQDPSRRSELPGGASAASLEKEAEDPSRRFPLRGASAFAGLRRDTTAGQAGVPGAASDVAVQEEGFVPLFNGVDLTGWTGDVRGYWAEDGVLAGKPLGNLYTVAQYGDFVLRFEFKLTPGANNGIGIRVPLKRKASTEGMEIQILDDTSEEYKDIKPYQYHGSIYGIVAADRGHLKPLGEWNSQEIRVDGTKVRVTLNGTVIVDADLKPYRDGQPTPDGKEHPGLKRRRGHISLAGHTTPIYYRNLYIKPL